MKITKKQLKKIIKESLTPIFQNQFGKIEIYYNGPDVGQDDYVRGTEYKGIAIQINAEGENIPLPSNLMGFMKRDKYGEPEEYVIDPVLNVKDRPSKPPMKIIYNTAKLEDMPDYGWEEIPNILKSLTGIVIPKTWFDAQGKKLDAFMDKLEEDFEEDGDEDNFQSPIMVLIRMVDGTWHSHIM